MYVLMLYIFISKDRPSTTERLNMAKSLITTFPILKDRVSGGCVCIIAFIIYF